MSVQAPTAAEKRRRSITAAQRATFLEALAAGYSVRHAAQEAGFNRCRAYDLRDKDEAFDQEWAEALEIGTQVLEDVARTVAVDGIREDVYDAEGKLLRSTRRPYPAMLMFLLKSRRPDVYRDNATAKVEVSGPNGGAIELDAGYRPTTLADVIALARELGIGGGAVDGEAVEDAELLELEVGGEAA